MKVKSIVQKTLSTVLAFASTVAIVPNIIVNNTVQAATVKNIDNTIYGTWGIKNPAAPSKDKAWNGSYVWFGDSPNHRKYRVLSADTNEFGAASLFLDCDSPAFYKMFEGSSATWTGSTIQTYLNGSFYNDSFTDIEKKAIMTSYKAGGGSYKKGSYEEYAFGKTTALNDKIFLLDAGDVTNETYGYSSYSGCVNKNGNWIYESGVPNHNKGDQYWWLRSTSKLYPDSCIGTVIKDGSLGIGVLNGANYYGVAPAMNIKRSSVVFATAIQGNIRELGTEYKLTLSDEDIKISSKYVDSRNIIHTEVTIDASEVSSPFTITGDHKNNASRVSVLILTGKYSAGNGNGQNMLYYDALDTTSALKGYCTFTLPSTFDLDKWGTDYRVYILAEDLNNGKQTDYASEPVEISMPASKIDVWDGTADKTYAKKGDTVTVTADPAPEGMRFDHWESYYNTVTFADPKSAKTTFKMVTGEVVISACYEFVEHKLTVEYDPKLATVDGIESTDHSVLDTVYKFTVKAQGPCTISVSANGKPVNCVSGYYTVVQPDEDLVVKIVVERNYSEEWVEEDGYWHYYDRHGLMYEDEWLELDGFWYYFDDQGRMMTDWQKIEGSWYYFGGNGKMRTGWQLISGVWYYFGGNGMMRTGWQEIGGSWYYFGGNGTMRTGWQQISGKTYYFKSSGIMAAGEYCQGYWLNSDGTWTYKYKATWRHNSKGWWYGDDSGWYAKNATYKIDDKKYDFDASGYCTTPNGY